LNIKLFNEIKSLNYMSINEIDPVENLNDKLLEYDLQTLSNELRFYNSIRSLSEDLEARLINALSNIQSKNKNIDIKKQLDEIIEINNSVKIEWFKMKNKNEYLDKLFNQMETLTKLNKFKFEECVSV